MLLSYSGFGVTAPTNKIAVGFNSYSKVNFKGNNVFDAAHLRDIILTDQEFIDLSTQETFGEHTVFLANFENNLEAGSYTSLAKPVTKWRIRRKRDGNFETNHIVDIPDINTLTYTDYLQANRTVYEYQVTPMADDGTEGAPIVSVTESDFFGWFLCSQDNETVYKFDMNLESESIALNMDIKLFEGFTKYPVMRTGKRKYRSGGLRTMPYFVAVGGIEDWYGMPYSTAGEIIINNEFLRKVEDFISNGETKILKNTSGDLFKVQTSDFSYQYMDTISEQPFTISFKWVQVGDGE